MNMLLQIGFYLGVSLVFLVLAAGIINILSRSRHQPSRSNKLMRWRVAMQSVTVLILILIGWNLSR